MVFLPGNIRVIYTLIAINVYSLINLAGKMEIVILINLAG
ncbi:hypothetical protein ASZ90_018609 [hydrocarbon metagenome]|uniref:Uncharacterized protein n=1 Tax=hydrocarbon metagenome TaxID=938273 RepID=A0A0W8E5S1_9ZZZZ